MASKPLLVKIFGDINPQLLKQPCQDEHLCELAGYVTDWPYLAPFLGVTKVEEDEIIERWPTSIRRRKIECLRAWKHKRGDRGTYQSLFNTLWGLGEVVLAEKVVDVLRCEDNDYENSLEGLSDELNPTDQTSALRSASPHRPHLWSEHHHVLQSQPGSVNIQAGFRAVSSHRRLGRGRGCSSGHGRGSQKQKYTSSSGHGRGFFGSRKSSHSGSSPIPHGLQQYNLSPTYLSPRSIQVGALGHLAKLVRKSYTSGMPGFADEWSDRLTLIGGAGITEERKLIQVRSLFSLDRQVRKVILVEGVPGSGKSTLAKHICQQWKSQQEFQDFVVVIFVPLDRNIQSIADLLPESVTFQDEDHVSQLTACHGKAVLFILDGWDKYVDQGHDLTFLDQLICNPKVLQLELSALLITSCPSATAELKPHASSWICIADPLHSLAAYLRLVYGSLVPGYVVCQWPPPTTQKVFNLTMIHTETIRRAPPNEELVRMMMRGAVSDVVRGSTSIKLESLFRFPPCRNRTVVLAEGPPGSGKSTLAWDIVQKWKAMEFFHEFSLVVFIHLRDPQIHKASCLIDLFPASSDPRMIDYIKSRNGDGILFVLDGWDEYTPGLDEDTLLRKLICNPHELHVGSSTLFITSRPTTSTVLQQFITTRVEIVGFAPSEVSKYFREALGNPESEAKLYRQLHEHPLLEASCYIPLNAAIVVHLFKELDHVLPTTLHGIFSALVCGCLVRHLVKESNCMEINIPSLEKIPSSIEAAFRSLCTLAYEGSRIDKVTFSREDLKSYNLSTELNGLSLMQGVMSFASHNSILYHFLHVSVQQLLAAFHISKLSNSKQVQIFKDLFDQPQFSAVFRFYAAFTKLEAQGIRENVANIAQIGDENQLLNLLHCLYEAHDPSLCSFVATQLNGQVTFSSRILSPLDCLSLGYFLGSVYQTTEGEFTVDLWKCSLTEHSVRFLVNELSYCSSTPSTVAVNHPTAHSGSHGYLALHLGISSRVQTKCLTELLSHSTVLTKLVLSEDSSIKEVGSRDEMKYILAGLKTNTSILQLELRNHALKFTEQNGPLLVEMLQENTTLQTLCFTSAEGEDVVTYLLEGLKCNRSIVKVAMCSLNLRLTERCGPVLVDALTHNSSLQVLYCNGDEDEGDAEYLYINETSHNGGIAKIYLKRCGITSTLTQSLAVVLSEHSSLRELDLSYNIITDNGVATIAEAITHNHGLQLLNISYCGLTDQGVTAIASALAVNTSLETLYMRSLDDERELSDVGLLTLGESFRMNRKVAVKTLDLYWWYITVEGLRTFTSCLRENCCLTELIVFLSASDVEELQQEEILTINEARRQQNLPLLNLSWKHGQSLPAPN